MTTLQDLITTTTRDDELADSITVAQTQGLSTTTWQSGSVIRTLLVIVAQKFSDYSQIIAEPIKGGFGDLVSSIDWATLWAKSSFGVDAVQAQPATGSITIVNSGSNSYTWAAGDVIVAHATTGKMYRVQTALTIPALTTLTDVPITAIEVGTASNASENTITVLVGPSMTGVTVTNPAVVLGSDAETVAQLVPRARSSFAALSPNGPKDAYNYVAKTPTLSATLTAITRAETYLDAGSGNVSVYLATADGAPIASDVAIVQAAEEKWAEPWGTDATAIAATQLSVDITYHVWCSSSLTSTQIQTAIADALANLMAALPIGGVVVPGSTGTLYVDAIPVAISGAQYNGQSINATRVDVSTPSADISMSRDQVAVLGTVTGTVTFV